MAYSSAILLLRLILVIGMLLLLLLRHIILASILVLQHGSNIVSAFNGIVTFVGFNGGGGYTVIIQGDEFTASYCHVSPNFLVYVGQFVTQGTIIATVGPKNVYDLPNNPYKDSSGNPTNGATTGPHLHFTLKKDGVLTNPLIYLNPT